MTQFPPNSVTCPLRITVSVTWGKYPEHQRRYARIKVGGLVVYEATWVAGSRAEILAVLDQLLGTVPDADAKEWRLAVERELDMVKV